MANFPTFLPKKIVADDGKQQLEEYTKGFKPLGHSYELADLRKHAESYPPLGDNLPDLQPGTSGAIGPYATMPKPSPVDDLRAYADQFPPLGADDTSSLSLPAQGEGAGAASASAPNPGQELGAGYIPFATPEIELGQQGARRQATAAFGDVGKAFEPVGYRPRATLVPGMSGAVGPYMEKPEPNPWLEGLKGIYDWQKPGPEVPPPPTPEIAARMEQNRQAAEAEAARRREDDARFAERMSTTPEQLAESRVASQQAVMAGLEKVQEAQEIGAEPFVGPAWRGETSRLSQMAGLGPTYAESALRGGWRMAQDVARGGPEAAAAQVLERYRVTEEPFPFAKLIAENVTPVGIAANLVDPEHLRAGAKLAASGARLATKGAREAIPAAARAYEAARPGMEALGRTLADETGAVTLGREAAPDIAPTYYSQLERVLESPKAPNKAGAESYLNFLKGQGVKDEELRETGVKAFLDERTASKLPVTRTELQEAFLEGQVQLKEVVKGEPFQGLKWVETPTGSYVGLDTAGQQANAISRLENGMYRLRDDVSVGAYPTLDAAKQQAEELAGNKFRADTKFSQYQLAGAKPGSYREWVLTLPEKAPQIVPKQVGDRTVYQVIGENGQLFTEERSMERAQLVANETFNRRQMAQYQSPHWDEPNPLAHIRFNDRIIDGKKTLFVEEIQSDWHQAGRKKGYQQANAQPRIQEINSKLNDAEWRYLTDPTEIEALRTELNSLRSGVPDAPFKKTWPALAMKRAIKWAADNGYDAIAWTPGAVHTERWGTERIAWAKKGTGFSVNVEPQVGGHAGGIDIQGEAEARGLIQKGRPTIVYSQEQLQRALDDAGIEAPGAAQKAEKRTLADRLWGRMQALDEGVMQPRHEGMQQFYDEMLATTANDLGKKYGARVREGNVPTSKANDALPLAVTETGDNRYAVVNEDNGTLEAGPYLTRANAERALEDIRNSPRERIQSTEPVHVLDLPPSMTAEAKAKGFSLFSPPEIGAGIVGAYSGYDPNKPLEENLPEMAKHGLGAGLGVNALRRGIKPGFSVEDITKGPLAKAAKEPWQMTRDAFRQVGGDTNAYIKEHTGASTPKQLLDWYKKKYPELKPVRLGGLLSTKESGPLVNEGVAKIRKDQGKLNLAETWLHLTKDADLTVARHEIEHVLDALHGVIPEGKAAFSRFPEHDKFNASDYLHRSLVRDAAKQGKPVPPEVLADYPDLAAKYGTPEPTTLSDVPERITDVSKVIQPGDTIRAKGIGGTTSEVIGEGSIPFGKKKIDGYKVRMANGREDFIDKDSAELVQKAAETISDRLAGKTSGRVGTLIVGDEAFPLSLRPDTSAIGTYSVVVTTPRGSQSYRMTLKKGESLEAGLRHFEDYMNTDSPTPYKVEVLPRQEPKPNLEPTLEQQWQKELKEREAKRFKTHSDEKVIDRLKRKIAADPAKWQEGQGVAWRVTGDQTNRGFRIIEVRPETKEAVIRSVADTGLTASGGNYDKIQDELVDIIDLARDKKYDLAIPATQAERDAARGAFQDKWARAYGDMPETAPIVKPERPPVPEAQELTMAEARKVAKMSDAELAGYNAKQQTPTPAPTPTAKKPFSVADEEARVISREGQAGQALEGVSRAQVGRYYARLNAEKLAEKLRYRNGQNVKIVIDDLYDQGGVPVLEGANSYIEMPDGSQIPFRAKTAQDYIKTRYDLGEFKRNYELPEPAATLPPPTSIESLPASEGANAAPTPTGNEPAQFSTTITGGTPEHNASVMQNMADIETKYRAGQAAIDYSKQKVNEAIANGITDIGKLRTIQNRAMIDHLAGNVPPEAVKPALTTPESIKEKASLVEQGAGTPPEPPQPPIPPASLGDALPPSNRGPRPTMEARFAQWQAEHPEAVPPGGTVPPTGKTPPGGIPPEGPPPELPSGRTPGGPERAKPVAATDPLEQLQDGLKPESKPFGAVVGEKFNAFMRATYDRNFDIGWLEKNTGIPAHKLAQLVSGATAAGEDRIRRFALPVVEPLGKDVKHLEEYMVLQRSKDLLAFNKDANLPGNLAGWQDVIAAEKRLRATLGPDRFNAVKAAAEKLTGTPGQNDGVFYEQILKPLLDNGLLSKEALQAMRSKHPHYIDFHRADFSLVDGIENVLRRPEASVADIGIKRMDDAGSARKLDQPLARSMAQIIRTKNLISRNKAAHAIVAALDKMQTKGLLPKDSVRRLTVTEAAEHSNVTDTISYFVDGKKVTYQVPPVYATIGKGLEAETAQAYQGVLAVLSAPLRMGAVTYNPIFIVANPIRDAWSAFFREGLVPFSPEYVRGWVAAITQNADFSDAAEAGVLMSGIVDTMRSTKAMARASRLGAITVQNPKDALLLIPRLIERANLTAEQATRIATYHKLMGQDISRIEAAVRARDVTVDFAKSGNVMKVINQILPFSNAGVQGASNTLRLLKDNPKQALIASGVLAMPTIVAYALNSRFETSKMIPEYEYVNNYVFMIGEGTKNPDPKAPNAKPERFPIYVKIPKGPTAAAVTLPVELAMRLAWAKDDRSIVEQLWRGTSIGAQLLSPVGTDISGVMPPILGTAAGIALNKDPFRGRDIVPLPEQRIPPEWQYDATTSSIAVALGDKFKVSPRMIDFAIKDYTAGVGQQSLWLSDLGLGALGYDPEARGAVKVQALTGPQQTAKIPGIGRFYGTQNTQQGRMDWEKFNTVVTETQREFMALPAVKHLGLTLQPVGDTITLAPNVRIQLELPERAALQQSTVRVLVGLASDLASRPAYKQLPDAAKRKAMDSVLSKGRDDARKSFLQQFTHEELRQRVTEAFPIAVGQ